MKYPKLTETDSSRDMISVFGGYNHNIRIGDNEFYDMQNMTSDYYPALASRNRRGVKKYDRFLVGIVPNGGGNDGYTEVLEDGWFGNHDLGLSRDAKKIVRMGAFVLFFPDKVWVNTETEEHGSMESQLVENKWHLSPCEYDGKEITIKYSGEQIDLALSPEDGDYWYDTSGVDIKLRKYNSTKKEWKIVDSYVKLKLARYHSSSEEPGCFNALFESYDTVDMEILGGQPCPSCPVVEFDNPNEEMAITMTTEAVLALTGTKTLRVIDEDTVIVGGLLPEKISIGNYISFKRTIPVLDVVFECGNRLWGARYGQQGDDFVNEIYCSKLGDFKNFRNFKGVSTDAYIASVGDQGRFTGGINFNGYPVFFKETCLYRVYGSYPAEFQIQSIPFRGVEYNSPDSLKMLGGRAYYMADDGIYCYDGSIPEKISDVLGNGPFTDGVAGVWKDKYYISMEGGYYPDWSLFVYDTRKGMWHREDDTRVTQFAECYDGLYGVVGWDKVYCLTGLRGTEREDAVEWMVETGEIGLDSPDSKYISRLTVRLSAEIGAEIRFLVKYDLSDSWEQIYAMTAESLRSFSLPLRPRRCDYMKLRIDGRGSVKIYSITKTIENGGENP